MGITNISMGKKLLEDVFDYKCVDDDRKIIALAGNPNVGKTTLFNGITGMHQHTGNWPGKTVSIAVGGAEYNGKKYIFVDLPGCYSLKSRSPEEEVARDFIKSGYADLIVVVCDATALERNLTLALQIRELTNNVLVCINLLDEAKKKNIFIDLSLLSDSLRCHVIGSVATKRAGVSTLFDAIENYKGDSLGAPIIKYPDHIEKLISEFYNESEENGKIQRANSVEYIEKNITGAEDDIVEAISAKAKQISEITVVSKNKSNTDEKIDRFLTNKYFGCITLFLLLVCVFWLTVIGANYPSALLGRMFNSSEKYLYDLLLFLKVPVLICDMLVYGVYHVLSWIVSVMLPPMAVFFPLFTFLEDVGFLPRVAFNLDKCFNKCSTCGKQALTMCMGVGCNAAGVVGCRIIDTPRERMIAILTNSFMPCNGRFPTVISVITMFFAFNAFGWLGGILPAAILSVFIVLSVAVTMLISKFLSKTILKGLPSFFLLELPPYRKPQIGKIIVRSVFDRTFFVLGRAITVAAPAGLIIWLASNVNINGMSIIHYVTVFFEPLGKMMGLDGVIITAFVLGFPANEIVFPLVLMMYTSGNMLVELGDLHAVKQTLVANGWSYTTALNMIIFMLFHWPCSTTCLTVKAETKSVKWTLIAFALPTLFGMLMCCLINFVSKLII